MIEMFKQMWQTNPSNTALFAVAFSGVITGIIYALRSQFERLFSWLSTQIFTTVTIASDNAYYYHFLTFLKQNDKLKHLRNLKLLSTLDISQGRWDARDNDNVKLSFINCSSILRIYNKFYFISFTSHQLENSNLEITNMHIKQFGRSFRNFDRLFAEVMKIAEENNSDLVNIKEFSPLEAPIDYLFKEKYTSVVKAAGVMRKNEELYNRSYSNPISKRYFDNVFLQEKTKNALIDRIQTFINDYEYYKKHHLNYHLGIILHGKPGCGKTSIIKAIAATFNFEIISLSSKDLDDLPKLLESYTSPNFIRFKRFFARNLEEYYKDNSNKLNKWKIENFDETLANIRTSSLNRWRSSDTHRLLWAAPEDLKEIPHEVLDEIYHKTILDMVNTNVLDVEATNKTISPIKFIVIEDIDTNAIVKSRDLVQNNSDIDPSEIFGLINKEKEEETKPKQNNNKKSKNITTTTTNNTEKKDKNWFEKYSESQLSEILNCLDGINTPDFFMIIATTNKIETIDPALLRPGRFDVCIEIPTVDKEVFNQFLNYYMPEEHKNSGIKDEDYELLPEVSIAKLQEHVLAKCTYAEIFEKFTTLKKRLI